MSFNPTDAVEVPLSVFGGLVTETSPPDLPEGVSPDCQDVTFLPGNVATRPGFKRALTQLAFGGAHGYIPTVSYGKSLVDSQGVQRNLYLDSNGVIWMENVTNEPGATVNIGQVAPGCYAKSVTAFGREYIAISDGLHGAEVPLQYDGTNLDRVTQDGPGASPTIANLILAASTISSLQRVSNIVTATVTAAHALKVGYQVQIAAETPAYLGSGIASIVVNNESLPGFATITMNAAHGLIPGGFVSIFGVDPVAVGGGLIKIDRSGQVCTATTNSGHGLYPGSVVMIQGTSADPLFEGTFTVIAVPNPDIFTYAEAEADGSCTGGSVNLIFPITSGPTPQYFQVVSVPTPTTFQVALSYSDGTWTGSGSVTFDWIGTFFVASVPSSTTFTYQHYGPNANSTSTTGTATPYGQAAPGIHQMQVSFLTRQGYITRPSPPVQFIANGGQYLSVSNIPIGPGNVVARILQFTGANGAYFYYIPTAAQINGQIVSTATQVNDNTTTGIVLDFSDNTLYGALGTSTNGNTLANQIVLEGCLGFGSYNTRLIAYGLRNRIQNLLNLGFDGGYLPSASAIPTGWQFTGSGGALATGHYGQGWQISVAPGVSGSLSQSAYLDAYGNPILQPNTTYTLRLWIQISSAVTNTSVTVTFSSASTSFSSTATITSAQANASTSKFLQANFSIGTPASIPADMLLTLSATSSTDTVTVLVDELSILYASTPYLDRVAYASYSNNPEAFDGVTGKFGPSTDSKKLMDIAIIRDVPYLLTLDPTGRLHEVIDSGTSEPAGWTVKEVASNCGVLSAFATTRSQADDGTASGGEEWFAWASSTGARIFDGNQPWKISQEIQPNWTGNLQQGFAGLNFDSQLTCWALNDPVERRMFFGVDSFDIPSAGHETPNVIFVLSYRGLDTAYEIANGHPIHISATGRLVATDSQRKWTRWTAAMNGAALMYRFSGSQLYPVFLNGNGQPPAAAGGFGNVYTIDPTYLSDDDYGQIVSIYTTHFFVPHDSEIALKLGAHRKMISYISAYVTGSGILMIQPLVDNLSNAWPLIGTRTLQANPAYDLEWTGGSCTGQRIALRISVGPVAGLTNYFSLSRLIVSMKQASRLPVRGAA